MSEKIEKYRKEIADIDSQIIRLANSRLRIAEKIGEIKRQRNLPVTNLRVEAEVVNRSVTLAKEIGLDENFAAKFINTLIFEAVKIQGVAPKNRTGILSDVCEKVKALEAKGEKVIRLDVGESDISASGKTKPALSGTSQSSSIGYSSTKGLEELREAIVDDLNQKYGSNIDAEQVLITPVRKSTLFLTALSMISPGDHVTLIEPMWPLYGSCVSLAHGRVSSIHTRLEDSWDIDLKEVEETFTIKPKLLIISSPSDPTGKVISEKMLHELAELAEKSGTYILADETYSTYSTVPFNSILQVANSNFVYVNILPKRYGLTGGHIGYAVSDVKTISRMQSLIQISGISVPEFIQREALKTLKTKTNPPMALPGQLKNG